MTLRWVSGLTGRAAGGPGSSHREVVYSKHFRTGFGISGGQSLCSCSCQSQCPYTACSDGLRGACWKLSAHCGCRWPGQGGRAGPDRTGSSWEPPDPQSHPWPGRLWSSGAGHLSASLHFLQGCGDSSAPRSHGASPTLRGSCAASMSCGVSGAQSPSPRHGWAEPGVQLPPGLASLAPAAGPPPGAARIPRGAWGGLYHPPQHHCPIHSLHLGSRRGGERGVTLGLSRDVRGVWDAERGLGC